MNDITVAIGTGLVFGFAIQKGQVYVPLRIAAQFRLEDFTMLKMFLSAASVSCIVHGCLSIVSNSQFSENMRSQKADSTKMPNYAQVVFGSSLLGVGMAVCGACPGTVMGQIGSGLYSGLIVFVGGLSGALLHTMFANRINQSFGKREKRAVYIEELFGNEKIDYFKLSMGCALVLGAVIAIVENLSPYVPQEHTWSPAVAGALIGLLQLPTYLVASRSLGSSSAYVYLANLPIRFLPKSLSSRFPSSTAQAFQPLYLLGAIVGAGFAAVQSGVFGNQPIGSELGGFGVVPSFVGGVLIVFGSRIAGGCTSGHGLSGFSKMKTASVLSTCAMFGAGIVAGLTIKLLF